MSPKASRRERSKALRTKRERGSSPAKTPTSRSRSGSLQRERREPVNEAMSPSVAQCMRAVFAAFMWHEGIVHDAMACASFLKFHPSLPKEMPKFKSASLDRSSLKSNKSSRGSTPSGSLTRQSKGLSLPQVDAGGNININEAVKKLEKGGSLKREFEGGSGRKGDRSKGSGTSPGSTMVKERHNSESRASEMDGAPGGSLLKNPSPASSSSTVSDITVAASSESSLPPTLKHLVYFWEEMSTETQRIITQNLIQPSPAVGVRTKKQDKKEREKDRKGKKSRKDGKGAAAGAGAGGGGGGAGGGGGGGGGGGPRGNLFGEAAANGVAAGAGGERETMCELCGGLYGHPVTYHMKQMHPGCGRHAGGQGYNSGGNYCGGWAGNCGDGGIGGSTWYLMCERCREKYLRDKKQAAKEKTKKSKKKNTPIKQSPVVAMLGPHIVMKNNAMFLLDLASSACLNLPTNQKGGDITSSSAASPVKGGYSILPSVSEDSLNNSPFPPVPFLYLNQRGAQAADSAFAEDVIFQGDSSYSQGSTSPVKGLSKSSQFDRSISHMEKTHTPVLSKITRSGSIGDTNSANLSPVDPLEGKSRSAEVSPMDGEGLGQGHPVLFQRSISEIARGTVSDPDSPSANQPPDANDIRGQKVVAVRRRNNSGSTAGKAYRGIENIFP